MQPANQPHPKISKKPSMPNVESSVMPESIRRIANSGDRQLAWQFFVFFSRFEYALKRCPKYLKPKRSAEPDWDRFSSDYNGLFQITSSELASAVDYFKQSPPRKQKQVDRELKWSEPMRYDDKDGLLVWLLLVIRTVRNNLFHGGKFSMPVSDPSRDQDLLRNAIIILDACLKLDPCVERQFFDGMED
jgi:hypothetical protein